MTGVKIFGREPTLYIALITAFISLAGTLGYSLLTGDQASLWIVLVNALAGAATAWAVRPISPAAFTYAIGAILALAAGYGLEVPPATVAAINALVIPALALLTRNQVSPRETVVTNA
ncbi:MAG TPA: hypothetical protein VI341_13870 [Actinomycetota bacterium]